MKHMLPCLSYPTETDTVLFEVGKIMKQNHREKPERDIVIALEKLNFSESIDK